MSENSQGSNFPKIRWNLKTILTVIAVIVVIYLAFTGKIPLFAGNSESSADSAIPIATQEQNKATQAVSAETKAAATSPTKTEATTQPAKTEAATKPAKTETATEKAYQAYYFRSSKLLNDHYDKHGKEMGFKSAKDYEKAASDVINNPNALTKREKEDNDYVFYVEATNEFVILSEDGYIRTYFNPSSGKAYYDRQ